MSVSWLLHKGSNFQRTLVWKNENDNPIDLTGYSVRMDIRDGPSVDDTLLYDVDGNNNITITDATGGEITIDIPAEDTKDFSFDVAHYDIEVEDSSGVVTTLFDGTISTDSEVTD